MKASQIIIVLIVLFSCTRTSNDTQLISVDDIESIDIKSTEIHLDEMPMFPKGCKVIDSVLILFEPKLRDGFISLYSLNNNNLIKRFGKIGNGPCDFIDPRFFPNYQFENNERSILIGDSRYLYKLNIDSIISGYNKCESSILSYVPAEMKGYNYILDITDTHITANITSDAQVSKFDLSNNKKETRSFYSKFSGININDFSYATQLYDGYYTSFNDKIIIAYKNLKQIDLISPTSNSIKNIRFTNYNVNLDKMKEIDDFNIRFEDNALYFYSYVFCTNSYFYALYWNATKAEIKENKAIPHIQMFNSNGELVKILKPDIAISYFCVDEKKSLIYAIGMSSEEELKIYSFNEP